MEPRDVADAVRARSLADWEAYWNAQGPLSAPQRRWRKFERELRINCAAKGCGVPAADDPTIAEIRCGIWERQQRENMRRLLRDRAKLALWKREGYSFDADHRLVAPALTRVQAPERREPVARPRERRAGRASTSSRDDPSPEPDPPLTVIPPRGLPPRASACARRHSVNLPKISEPLTATELRDRVLAQLNGESRNLSPADRKRRARVLAKLRKAER
jgi:hypothetical protein